MNSKSINELYPECLFSVTEGIRIIWGISYECNLRCKHCAAQLKETPLIPLQKYFEALENMRKTNVDTIYFSGGEPLLFENIYDLIKVGKKLGFTITLGTNGTLLDEETVKKLKESNIDKIFISLDHWEKEKHEWLRGKKNIFKKIIDGIELLKKYEIPIRIDSIIWKQNYENIEKLVEFCEKIDAEEVMLAWPVKVGLAKENYSLIAPPKEEYFNIGKKLEIIKKSSKIKVSYHRFKYFNQNCKDCPGGEKIFYINPEGKVSSCFWISCIFNFFSEKTIFEEKFSNLMHDKALEYFEVKKKRRYEKFGPGCPAVCVIENESFYSKDPLLLNL